jgi:hypothetical protein
MKVGRGFVGPMSNNYRKCKSRGRSFFLYTATLIVLGLSLLLAGCGQISLNQLLENEEPGEFRLSPEVASIPVDSSITVEGKGGFKPYTYELIDGDGEFDPETGKYDATGVAEVAEIEGTDGYGRVHKATIHVIAPLSLKVNGESVSTISIVDDPDDDPVELEAEGGDISTSGTYTYYVDGTWAADTADGTWDFDPPTGEATCTVEVEDDLGNSAIVTVVVVGPAVAINPKEKQVVQGGSVFFTGLNVDGTAVYTASPDVGVLNVTGDDAEYVADTVGTITITLTDEPSGEYATATVYVLPVDPGPLEISPSSATLRYEDSQVFEVSGGVPPYTLWLWYLGDHGKLEQISATQALYTAPYAKTTDWVMVKDSAGMTESAKVKVKKPNDND